MAQIHVTIKIDGGPVFAPSLDLADAALNDPPAGLTRAEYVDALVRDEVARLVTFHYSDQSTGQLVHGSFRNA